jgi:hypothetical protein
MKEGVRHWFFIAFILSILFLLPISIIYLLYLQSANSSTLGNIIVTILYLIYIISAFFLFRKTIKKNPTFEKFKDIRNPLDPREEYKKLRKRYVLRLMENIVLFLLFEFLVLVVFFIIKIQFT